VLRFTLRCTTTNLAHCGAVILPNSPRIPPTCSVPPGSQPVTLINVSIPLCRPGPVSPQFPLSNCSESPWSFSGAYQVANLLCFHAVRRKNLCQSDACVLRLCIWASRIRFNPSERFSTSPAQLGQTKFPGQAVSCVLYDPLFLSDISLASRRA
jgi:hypothetical protein